MKVVIFKKSLILKPKSVYSEILFAFIYNLVRWLALFTD